MRGAERFERIKPSAKSGSSRTGVRAIQTLGRGSLGSGWGEGECFMYTTRNT